MNKKFTEDQYQEIVDVKEKYFPASIYYQGDQYDDEIKSFQDALVYEYPEFASIVNDSKEEDLIKADIIMALANPLTRDQSYNKYVSDLYLWRFYLPNGEAMSLYETDISDDIYFGVGEEATPFSENELKNSPIYDENGDKTNLDLSMFKKELVNEEEVPF